MKITHTFAVSLAVALSIVMGACQKDEADSIGPNDKNNVVFKFENRVGNAPLVLNTTNYKNGSGEEFNVSTFNYFISNISLKKDDGTVVKFPNQYFLVRAVDSKSSVIELKDVPAANYQAVSFMVGVDSTKSVADVGERTGVLDVAAYGDDGMYWSWNSGYIFMKIEGTSPVVPLRASGLRKFQLHVGGFGGKTSPMPNNTRTVTLTPIDGLKVRATIAPEVRMITDVAKIFNGTTTIKLAETNSVHSPAVAIPIANNYVNMFTIDRVLNENK
jgi:hypothetical protein